MRRTWIHFGRVGLVLALLSTACSGGTEATNPVKEGLALDLADVDPTASDRAVASPRAEPISATPAPDEDLGLYAIVRMSVADIEGFWGRELPLLYGVEFMPVAGVVAYHPSEPLSLPPCDGEVARVDAYIDNAFYCAVEDTLIFDVEGLIAETYESFGEHAAAIVLAHEYAHAIQARVGEESATIFMELQADCFAGAWRAESGAGTADAAIELYLQFPDDAGTPVGGSDAHGSAFDRVTAFAHGFVDGAAACTTYDTDPPAPAGAKLSANTSLSSDTTALAEFVPALLGDLDSFWSEVGPLHLGADYQWPVFVPSSSADPRLSCDGYEHGSEFDGRVVLCLAEHTIIYDDVALLPMLWTEDGDFAAAYPLVAAHSQAVLVASGGDPTAPGFGLATDCLNGAFLGDLFLGHAEHLSLVAGDLDESLEAMVRYEPVRPGFARGGRDSMLRRVNALRTGFHGSVTACGIPLID